MFARNAQQAKILIDAGAEVNAFDNRGNTPIAFAKDNEHNMLLIESGSKTKIIEIEGAKYVCHVDTPDIDN